MYTLYNEPRVVTTPSLNLARFGYVKAMHQSNLDRVVSHYRRSAKSVRSDHLLVQLLQHIHLDLSNNLLVFRDRVKDIVDDLTRSFDLTSPINYGKALSPGMLYGKDTSEIILVTEEEFNLDHARNNWERLEPLKFLTHPKTDLGLNLPYGEGYSVEKGVVVATLNLPMLACQYRLWFERELRRNPERPGTVTQFVAQYPIPNSMSSQQDIAFLNRLTQIFYGEAVSEHTGNHPFFLNTRDVETNKGLLNLVQQVERRRLGFSEFLETVTPINEISYQKVIALPRMVNTRQVVWALVIARLPVISFLLHWGEVVGNNRNRQDLNQIRRSLRQLRHDRGLDQLKDPELSTWVEEFIDKEVRPFL